jgi:hypothetical protein
MTQGETEQQIGTAGASLGWALFTVFGGAGAWTLHLLGSYAIVAIGCGARWRGIEEVVAIGTLVLAGLAAWSTISAWRGCRRSSGEQAWDQALSEPRGWFAWLMTIGVLLGAVSVLAILVEGAGVLLLPACGWDAR